MTSAKTGSFRLGPHQFPALWRRMFPEDIQYYRVDSESGSSCFSCPQVKSVGLDPAIRCCTVIPSVSNFLIGQGLQNPDSRAPLLRYVESGYTLPEGTLITPRQLRRSLQYIQYKGSARPTLFCPFLDQESRRCGIYLSRSTVCSTFFCRHDNGETGAEFWQSLQDLGSQIETALSRRALREIGFSLESYWAAFDEIASDIDRCHEGENEAWSLWARERLWGSWMGRETELFIACADWISSSDVDLFAEAGKEKPVQTLAYDAALRSWLGPDFKPDYVAEALPEGTPEGIDSLWYTLQLAHRNLQLKRLAKPQP